MKSLGRRAQPPVPCDRARGAPARPRDARSVGVSAGRPDSGRLWARSDGSTPCAIVVIARSRGSGACRSRADARCSGVVAFGTTVSTVWATGSSSGFSSLSLCRPLPFPARRSQLSTLKASEVATRGLHAAVQKAISRFRICFFFLLLLESHIIQSNFLKLVSRSRISFGYDTP